MHDVVVLDTNDVVVMRQWSEIHLEWLRKHDLWEQADQDQLDDPQGKIVDVG